MSQISQKSISGITSITTPAGIDDIFTVHSGDTTERFRVDQSGNQNISGIVTATNFKTGSSNLHSTGLTVGDSFVHSTGINIGSNIKFGSTGVITATSFVGDGSDLTNLPAGLGTALSATASSPLNKMYYTNQVLGVPSSVTVDVPASASKAYTQYADIKVDGSADLIVAEGDDLIPDILGLADFGTFGGGASAGRIRVNSISNAANDGSPTVQKGLVVTGVCTATSFSGSGANLTGVLKNVVEDSSPQLGGDLTSNGNNIVITDGEELRLGNDHDTKIKFNGSKSQILSSVQFDIDADIIDIHNAASNSMKARFLNNQVELYYANSKKFETSSSGITITGGVTATSFVGSGAQLTGIVGGKFGGGATGIQTVGNVGVQTADMTSANLVGAASSLVGLYIGDGSLLFSNNLSRSGGYYITTGVNALNAGPVSLNSTLTLDGTWVIV